MTQWLLLLLELQLGAKDKPIYFIQILYKPLKLIERDLFLFMCYSIIKRNNGR